MDTQPEWARLLDLLAEARSLLEDVGEQHWAGWLAQQIERLNAFGATGIASLLQGYGGMGSFNDLILHQRNGHEIDPDDEERLNARLDDLRSAIYRTATGIRENAE